MSLLSSYVLCVPAFLLRTDECGLRMADSSGGGPSACDVLREALGRGTKCVVLLLLSVPLPGVHLDHGLPDPGILLVFPATSGLGHQRTLTVFPGTLIDECQTHASRQ